MLYESFIVLHWLLMQLPIVCLSILLRSSYRQTCLHQYFPPLDMSRMAHLSVAMCSKPGRLQQRCTDGGSAMFNSLKTGYFFQIVISFPEIVSYSYDISEWNWPTTMNIHANIPVL